MESIRSDHPLRRLFAGLVENAFCGEVGLCDPALTEYVADLLVDFTRVDRLNAMRRAQGKRLDHIASMLVAMTDDVPADATDRERAVYRNIGDYTLFWAGVYPEQLRQVSRQPSDVLMDYVANGKRSYAIVSELANEDEEPPPILFRHLSDEFESCLYGLGLVRRGLERQNPTACAGGDILF